MEILSLISYLILLAMGLPVGLLFTLMESKKIISIEFFFAWVQNIILIMLGVIFLTSMNLPLYVILPILVILIISILLLEPKTLIGYTVIILLLIFFWSEESSFMIVSLIGFFYGIPSAPLIRMEKLKELEYPFRSLLKRTFKIGHRGAPALDTENTLGSFQKAIDHGVDMIETDASTTKDERIILLHDQTVDKTTNGKGYAREMTFSKIRKLKTNNNEKIPTLQEAIDLLKRNNKCELNLHIKDPEITRKAVEIIKKNDYVDKTIISSYYIPVLKEVKKSAPSIRLGLLLARPHISFLKKIKKIDIYSLHPHYRTLTKRLACLAHNKGYKINVFGIRRKGQVIKCELFYNVDGILTDDPILYRQKRPEKEKNEV